MSWILSDVIAAMRHLGVDPDVTIRAVIDLDVRNMPVIYIQTVGDRRLLSVVQTLDGVKIEREANIDG